MLYDLIVIGGGSAGVRAARWSASLGAKVAIIEKAEFGGTCVVRGCIPKKIMVMAAHMSHEISVQKNYGWSFSEQKFSWETLKRNRDAEVERLTKIYEEILRKAGVEIIKGKASLRSPHEVECGGEVYQARYIMIATGGRPELPDMPGGKTLLTSDDFFNQRDQARRVAIIGSGYIGVELAGIYQGLGSEVHLICRHDRVLNRFDHETARELTERLKNRGMRLYFNSKVEKVELSGNRYRLITAAGETIEADLALSCVGRTPLTEGLGLEHLNIQVDKKGSILVDEKFETNVKGVFAIGDVSNKLNLTPVALAEGMWVSNYLFGKKKPGPFIKENVPTAVFSQPAMATVGLTEEECVEQKKDIQIFRSQFRPLKHTVAGLQEKAFIKMIVEKSTDRVLGLHVIADEAPEMMQGFAVAIRHGLTKSDFDETIGIHPTLAEEVVTMRG